MFKKVTSIILLGSLLFLLGCTSTKTLSLKEKEDACSKNNSQLCAEVAEIYLKKKEYEKGLKYAQIACDANHAEACSTLGRYYIHGTGVKQNTKKGIEFYEKACNIGNGQTGCIELALLYSSNYENIKGIKKNYAKSNQYFKSACEKGLDATSCSILGGHYALGMGSPKDIGNSVYYARKAFNLYRKDCHNNDLDACRHVGDSYKDGEGIIQDYKKALEYYSIGCDKNDYFACVNMGFVYQFGDYSVRDSSKAKEYYLKACDNNIKVGCELFSKLNY